MSRRVQREAVRHTVQAPQHIQPIVHEVSDAELATKTGFLFVVETETKMASRYAGRAPETDKAQPEGEIETIQRIRPGDEVDVVKASRMSDSGDMFERAGHLAAQRVKDDLAAIEAEDARHTHIVPWLAAAIVDIMNA